MRRRLPAGAHHALTAVRRVIAPNPGPYTGPGTNTWLLDAGPVTVVIDPGPDDDAHLDAIHRALKGAAIAVVLVTHSHPDHFPLAARLAELHRAPVRRFPELADGDVVRAGNLNITALHTPGHSSDHLSFWLPADRAVFTGDLVLGRVDGPADTDHVTGLIALEIGHEGM